MHSSVVMGKTLIYLSLALCIAGCSGGGSNTTPPTQIISTPTTGAASVYVIQNPATYGNGSGTILQFSASSTGSVSPTATITAPANTSFNTLSTDSTGNIYTVYAGPTNPGGLVEYAAGATGAATPIRTLPFGSTTGVTAVDGITTSSTGEIFVAEDYGGIQAFSATATGNVAPSRRILGAFETGGGLSTLGAAWAIAADSSDNLYVLNEGYPVGGQPLVVFGPTATGNIAPLRTIGGAMTGLTGTPVGITTDSTGNLYVTTYIATGSGPTTTVTGTITEFAAGASGNIAPMRTITGSLTQLNLPAGIKIDSAGNIFVLSASIVSSSNVGFTVLKFSATASGNVAPTSTFTSTSLTNPDNSGSIALR
jgi:hypothetical protein